MGLVDIDVGINGCVWVVVDCEEGLVKGCLFDEKNKV